MNYGLLLCVGSERFAMMLAPTHERHLWLRSGDYSEPPHARVLSDRSQYFESPLGSTFRSVRLTPPYGRTAASHSATRSYASVRILMFSTQELCPKAESTAWKA